MVTIGTSTDTFRSVEKWRVDTASKLTDNSWTEQLSLHVNRLSTVAGPDIDTAELEFNYGIYADQEKVSLLSLDRKYVRLILRDTDSEPDNPTATQMKDNAFVVWYGIIEVDERDTGGTRTINSVEVPTGDQKFTAYGLLRELELTFVTESVVNDSVGNFEIINRAIPFNLQATSQYPDRGNSTTVVGGPIGTTRIFSFSPFTDDDENRWDALTALEYTLEYDVPEDANGNEVFRWILTGITPLDWFDITVERDRRSVKDIIDDLIDRRRLTGYYIEGVEDDDGFHAEMTVFTFNDKPLNLDETTIVFENARQFILNFESSFDVEVAVLSNNSAHRTDRVTVRGAFITSTFSCFIATNYLEEGWTAAEETTFKDAAKNIAGYAASSTADKQKANQIARTQDSLKDVFAKFVISDNWDQTLTTFAPFGFTYYVAVVELPDVNSVDDITREFDTLPVLGNTPSPLWHKGKTFLRYIPIREQSDDDLSDYRDPFVIFRTTDAATDIWEFGHQLSSKSVFDDADARQFSTRLVLLDKELGFRVEVGAAGGQQLIASDDWDGAETTKEEYDPTTAESNGVNYKEMIITATMEWDDRIEITVDSPAPDPPIDMEGRMLREMFIDVPDARLDFIIPDTVTDIDDAGALIQIANGQIVRDDRRRMTRLAEIAAEWFGRKRQALQLRYKQIRPPTDGTNVIKIGDLITSVGTVYSDPDVNSVVTSIVYDMTGSPTTTVETSYAHLDIASVF